MSKDINRALWDAVFTTDPMHVKPIIGKTYKGDSPKPHWLVLRATETFGPCGIGWGVKILKERVEAMADGSQMHIAHVAVWFLWNGERGEVEHIGATPISGKRKSGEGYADEDAAKKSVTDGMVKAMSMLGFAGDIFMGLWNDSKYVEEAGRKYEEEERQDKAKKRTPAEIANGDAAIAQAVKLLEVAAEQGFEHLSKEWKSRIAQPLNDAQIKAILKDHMPRIKKAAQEVGDARE